MKILLTGAAGFIGSACAVAFLERGWEVVGVDCFEPTLYGRERKEENLEWVRTHGDLDFHEVDVRDADALAPLCQGVDVVVHLAAIAGVRPSIALAPRYYDFNVTATATVLGVARAAGVGRFVLASSSSVYGGNEKVPFAEDDRIDAPVSPYAASKVALEVVARADQHLHGGHVTCLRFFTVYGPRQRPEMAIHKFMRIMAEGGTIPMYGDGSTGRDYTFVDDIVAGVVASVERPDGFAIYNLGGDRVVLLRDLIAAIGEAVGVEPRIERLPMQPGDVLLTNADVSLARRELDYAPETALEQGLAKMWEWYRERGLGEA